MTIYAIGAYFAEGDISKTFIENNMVGLGWGLADAPDLHQLITTFKVGDIVYIKAVSPGKPIVIRGIGLVKDSEIISNNETISIGRNILWLSDEEFTITKPTEKNNVRLNSIYEEFSPSVQSEILKRISLAMQSKK